MNQADKDKLLEEFNCLNEEFTAERFDQLQNIFQRLSSDEMSKANNIIYDTGNNLEMVLLKPEGLSLIKKLNIKPEEFRSYMRMLAIVEIAKQNP